MPETSGGMPGKEKQMKRIHVKSYAKINLSLDVLRRLENGYHEVEMVMQQILLNDEIDVKWIESDEPFSIVLHTNRSYLPTDERNLAYKAALLMHDAYGSGMTGELRIDIKKRIPVAAGLAGGSGNGAAVLHAVNKLWELGLDVAQLNEIGSKLGSDVPFCIMGQAAMNKELGLTEDPLATHCAVATGTGTDLRPVTGLQSHLVLSKPAIGVSTAEVYQGLDLQAISIHPDTEEMVQALAEKNMEHVRKNMINLLENFTLERYPSVMRTKEHMQDMLGAENVLMSGSGPTVFGLCGTREQAQQVCEEMTRYNKESFWTRTTF